MQTKTIANMEFTLDPFNGKTFYVHIAIDGSYYDSREFYNFDDAASFFADPLADDRSASQRKAKPQPLDTSYLDSVNVRNIYRRTA